MVQSMVISQNLLAVMIFGEDMCAKYKTATADAANPPKKISSRTNKSNPLLSIQNHQGMELFISIGPGGGFVDNQADFLAEERIGYPERNNKICSKITSINNKAIIAVAER